MTKLFTDPVLAKCSNRTELAKENPVLGNPDIWFKTGILRKVGIRSVSFDFFINWSNNILHKNLWLKRPTIADIDVHSLTDLQVNESLREDKFLELVLFSRKNKFSASAIIYSDYRNWNDQSHLLHVFWPREAVDNKYLRIDRVDLLYIKQQIITNSGGPVRIGSKGLIYGTSRLECFLSQGDALWPGDADLVLLNNDYSPLAVLEFKKHTKSSRILFEDQGLGNYYPWPDARKYDRLKLLSNQINSLTSIPLFVVYYSIESNEHRVIVEQVSGYVGELKATSKQFFTIDENNVEVSSEEIIRYICSKSKPAHTLI